MLILQQYPAWIFFVELESPVSDLTVLQLEIDYIQLGSYVDWAFNTITGNIFNDNNGDCQFNSTDNPVKHSLVKALPGPYYAYTDENGFYELKVDTLNTSYTVSYTTDSEATLIEKICPASGMYSVSTPKGKSTYCCHDFAQKIKQCAVLKIDINSDRRRRCFKGFTYVNYQNVGNINSSQAQIKVVYPEFVKPISSTPAWTSKVGDTLYYTVGLVAPYSQQTITIIDSVICGIESIRSLTQCTQAMISPANACLYEDIDWNNSDVIVRGKCDMGIAKFTILNGGSGDMPDSTAFRVYTNDTLISTQKFALRSQEYFQVQLPAYGKVIRLEADQSANHPAFNTIPRVSLEGCVTNQALLQSAYKGIAMNTPLNNDFVSSTSCMQITDSYDPNDKAVFPVGQSERNYISAGTKLNYTIRFENTGSDDAYTVVVVDTLDSDLDASTFLAGSSSHSYSIKREVIDDREIVTFQFTDINLSPKKVDSIKSQGFIKFSISTRPDVANGMLIENEANIFFDYNSAIVTNKVSQTIGEYIEEKPELGSIVSKTPVNNITTGLTSKTNTKDLILLYPNPVSESITIKFPRETIESTINVYTIDGATVLTQRLGAVKESRIILQQLPQGIYYYSIADSSGLNQHGKIIKQ